MDNLLVWALIAGVIGAVIEEHAKPAPAAVVRQAVGDALRNQEQRHRRENLIAGLIAGPVVFLALLWIGLR